MATANLTLGRLRELLSYDPKTGVFVSLTRRKTWESGRVTGAKENRTGYGRVIVDGTYYRAHRLAWFYVHGEWPHAIDHINGNRYDNRLCNLRSVSVKTNNENLRVAKETNQSGFLGVRAKSNGKFAADIKATLGGKRLMLYLGSYATAEEAHAVYVDAKRRLHDGCSI